MAVDGWNADIVLSSLTNLTTCAQDIAITVNLVRKRALACAKTERSDNVESHIRNRIWFHWLGR